MGIDIGSVIAVSAGLPASNDTSGFGALTFTDVGEVSVVSERGDSSADIATPGDIKNGRVKHYKGAADGGEITLTVQTEDFSDAGQDIVRTAAAPTAEGSISLRVTRASGDIEYYQGVCSDYKMGEMSTESYRNFTFLIRVNDAPVIDEA